MSSNNDNLYSETQNDTCENSGISSSDDLSETSYRTVTYKRPNIPASYFSHGCTCGHNICYRDMFSVPWNKKNINFGPTIKPKVPPINAKLRKIK